MPEACMLLLMGHSGYHQTMGRSGLFTPSARDVSFPPYLNSTTQPCFLPGYYPLILPSSLSAITSPILSSSLLSLSDTFVDLVIMIFKSLDHGQIRYCIQLGPDNSSRRKSSKGKLQPGKLYPLPTRNVLSPLKAQFPGLPSTGSS